MQISDRGVSDFRLSCQSLIENSHNHRASGDIHIKLEQINNLEKKEKQPEKNLV